jgi:hypothetical protein
MSRILILASDRPSVWCADADADGPNVRWL